MSASLADVFRSFAAGWLDTHAVSAPQARVMRAILDCRTAALGGHCEACDACGHPRFVYHSCRNRHCPTCQSRAKEAWTRQRMTELLPVPYTHLVFTLPHALNGLAARHDRWLYTALMTVVASVLTDFARNPRWLGAQPLFSLVLHTWTQDLRRHVHVHGLMACGGLDAAGHWRTPKRDPRFLFPVRALSAVFRGRFMAVLDAAIKDGRLPDDPASTPAERAARRKRLLRHDWVVYAKTPLGGPAEVLHYLSRYTHRTAISNERIVAIRGDTVLLRVRDNHAGGKRVIRVPGAEFTGRFLQHVLPPGFKRIRHYGVLSAACKKRDLERARLALNAPAPSPVAMEEAADFMSRVARVDIHRCPVCGEGTMVVVAFLVPDRSAASRPHPALCAGSAAFCRGPPP